eukprot:1077813-Pleurochrysis_carterae.AAC.1
MAAFVLARRKSLQRVASARARASPRASVADTAWYAPVSSPVSWRFRPLRASGNVFNTEITTTFLA